MLISCNREHFKTVSEIHHVDVLKTQLGPVPYQLDYPGVISGQVDFPVVARVNGTIYKKLYKDGTMVKKGQELYQIDPRPFQNELSLAKAELSRDQATLSQNKVIMDRYNKLYPIGAVSKQDLENSITNYNSSKALVAVDLANVNAAKLNLTYSKVVAPVDGLISKEEVTVGTMVSAYQTVLNHINSGTKLYVDFAIPENDRLSLQSDVLSGKVTVPQDYKFSVDLELSNGQKLVDVGMVSFLDTRISRDNGSLNMRATINNTQNNNKQSLPLNLLSGQFVHVYLKGAMFKNTIVIPQLAVLRDNVGAFVYVLNPKTSVVAKRPVTTGRMLGANWIIESGLAADDMVVINGGIKISPNEKVLVDSVSTTAP